MPVADKPTPETAPYCYLDFHVNASRAKLARAAAFVAATDTRYSFSSQHLLRLGGAEVAHRVAECYEMDHEWGSSSQPIQTRPPLAGNRLVVCLLWDQAPLACENFATLCAQGADGKPAPVGQSGKPLTYRQSTVHRIVPGFIVQGGDFVFGNGSGGESIYNGKKFKDERAGLMAKHDRVGILSMGNAGKNSNSSQFFLTFDACPQCDGKHVIFGHIVSGWEVLTALEQVGSSGGDPTVPVRITDCGIWKPLETPGAGFWYDQPDPETYAGISPVFVVRPRVAVVGSTAAVIAKFRAVLGTSCVVTAVPVDEEPSLLERLQALLRNFAVDVVVVAPACSPQVTGTSLDLPAAFGDRQVVVTAKPVQALAAVRQQTWLAEQNDWQLDGA